MGDRYRSPDPPQNLENQSLAEADDKYRPDHNRGNQIGLGLEFGLGATIPIRELEPGRRFIQRGTGAEGRLVEVGNGSATVAILKEDGKWARTTWSLETRVSPLAT